MTTATRTELEKFTEEGVDKEFLRRLRNDIRRGYGLLTNRQARFLVDTYYTLQKNRIRSDNQVRALNALEEPHDVISLFSMTAATLETLAAEALTNFAETNPLGEWSMGIRGCGPILSAAYLAYIDLHKVQTVGQIWRFMGYDPTIKWYSRTEADKIVSEYWPSREKLSESVIHSIAVKTNHRPETLKRWAQEFADKKITNKIVERITSDITTDYQVDLEPLMKWFTKYGEQKWTDVARDDLLHLWPSNVVNGNGLTITETTAEWIDQHAKGKITRDSLQAAVAKRPFCAAMKTTAFKLGTSFVKNSFRDDCYYGDVYLARKAYEIEKNSRGDYKAQAERALTEKKYGKTTKAYKCYSKGQLPPQQIHLRAIRYTVKLFTAHWFEKGCELILHKKPPKPYAIDKLAHAHYLPPPEPCG